MNSKTFVRVVLLSSLAILVVLAMLTAMIDPFFFYHAPSNSEVFQNERYENAGMIRNLEYDTVLMGTSLVANHRASWYDDLTGGTTIKIAYRDGYMSDFNTALTLAFETHSQIKQVFFGMDANILARSDATRTVDLPDYLYNQNPFDNVDYFLNKDVYIQAANKLYQESIGNVITLDNAYVWDGNYPFSKAQALASYQRPEISGTVAPDDAYFAACDENLTVITGWLEAHPDVDFTFFISPYSILFWDKMEREGDTEAMIAMLKHAIEKLLPYDNLRLCFYMGDQDIITNLDNYTDHIHCSGTISYFVAQSMQGDDFLLTEDNYQSVLDHLENLVTTYDYDSIYQ
jgi:hypothetical protein